MAATSQLSRFKVLFPSGGCWTEVREVSGRGILLGKSVMVERGSPRVSMGVILHMTLGARKAHNICCRIMQSLDMWEIRQYADLCSETMAENQ